MNVEDKNWHIMTKTRNGTVSLIRNLSLSEAKEVYERLDPCYGQVITRPPPRPPSAPVGAGTAVSIDCSHVTMRMGQDNDITQREVLGPAGWDSNEVRSWPSWPQWRDAPAVTNAERV